MPVTLNVFAFSWLNKHYIKRDNKNNYILYFINIIFYLFNILNNYYTFHSVVCIFTFYSKIITKGSNNLNNILERLH